MIPDPKTAAGAPENPSRVEEPAAAYDPSVAGVQVLGRLRESDFSDRQARGVVVAVRDLTGDLATAAALADVKKDVGRIEKTMATDADLGIVKKDVEHIKDTLATSMATKAGLDLVKKDVEHIKESMAALATKESVSRINEILPTLATKESVDRVNEILPTLATKESVDRVNEILPTLATKESVDRVNEILPTLATKDALELVKKDIEHIRDTMVTEEALTRQLQGSNRRMVATMLAAVGAVAAVVGLL